MTPADLLIIAAQVIGVSVVMAAALSHIAKALEFREAEMRREISRVRTATFRASIKCSGRG